MPISVLEHARTRSLPIGFIPSIPIEASAVQCNKVDQGGF